MSDLTPAGELSVAAAHMRQYHGPGHVRHEFWTRLADWLGACAGQLESGGGSLSQCDDPGSIREALDLARAYLGSKGDDRG